MTLPSGGCKHAIDLIDRVDSNVSDLEDLYLKFITRLRVHSDRMRCDFFAANNRMRFTHASRKINATHVIQ